MDTLAKELIYQRLTSGNMSVEQGWLQTVKSGEKTSQSFLGGDCLDQGHGRIVV